jgi:uncharacterized protein DUF87/phospholipase D-like protein
MIVTNETILVEACRLLAQAKTEVCLCSPWITKGTLQQLLDSIPTGVRLRVVFRICEPRDLDVTSAGALQILRKRKADTKIHYSRELHAKGIFVDGKSGLISSSNVTSDGMSKDGNLELGVSLEGAEAAEAQKAFEAIWAKTTLLPANCVGFLLNPTAASQLTFVALDPELLMETIVQVNVASGWLLGRVIAHRRWNRNFFADPYNQETQGFLRQGQEPLLRPGQELLPRADSADPDWNFAGVKALTWQGKGQGGDVLIVDVSVEAYIENDIPRTPLAAPLVGAEVLRGDQEHLKRLLSGPGCVDVGKLIAQPDVLVGLKLEDIARQHLSVMGMTGSGKSYFMKVFLRALKNCKPWTGDVFVFDAHAEYDDIPGFERLKVPPDMLFFVDETAVHDWVDARFGKYHGSTNPGKERKESIASAWRNTSQELWRSPVQILEEMQTNADLKKLITTGDQDAAMAFQEWYPQFEAAVAKGGHRVIDLMPLDDPSIRTDLVGLMLGRLYDAAKTVPRARLIVLEEAHSLIPEKSEASDVSGGKDNPALRQASRIASEGRKFNLGLVVVTQRPAKVNKGVLSQCNTQVLFRLMNPSDLNAVTSSVEGASKEVLERLPRLRTGECLISGLAIPFPLVCRIHEIPAVP